MSYNNNKKNLRNFLAKKIFFQKKFFLKKKFFFFKKLSILNIFDNLYFLLYKCNISLN